MTQAYVPVGLVDVAVVRPDGLTMPFNVVLDLDYVHMRFELVPAVPDLQIYPRVVLRQGPLVMQRQKYQRKPVGLNDTLMAEYMAREMLRRDFLWWNDARVVAPPLTAEVVLRTLQPGGDLHAVWRALLKLLLEAYRGPAAAEYRAWTWLRWHWRDHYGYVQPV